jgi:hypothetical protein
VQNVLSFKLPSKNIRIKIYRNIILNVALNGCKTWSPILREERRPKEFDNSVLNKIFVPKRAEVRGEWRKLHKKELSDIYCLV